MAQQASNAQREPSMDEILASIRRIIEESEPDRAGADLSAIEQLTSGPGPAANDPVLGVAEAEALQAAVLAEARLERKPELATDILSEAFDPDSFSLDSELDSAFRLDEREPMLEQPTRVEPVSSAATLDYADLSEVMAASSAERARTIISEQTGRQVAASFGNLAEAFAANRQRSLDEVAEEMMRPMLQDWMDNNLPTLVEKLVREEIERVARGS